MRFAASALLGTLIAFHPGFVFSQTAPLKTGTRTISVTGQGSAKAKPDLMSMSFPLESEAPSGAQCSKLQQKKMSKAVAALKAKLGDAGSVETSNYSLNQRMVPENSPSGAPTAQPPSIWRFSESIKVVAGSISELTPLIDTAMEVAPDVYVSASGYDQPYPPQFWGVRRDFSSRAATSSPTKTKKSQARPFIVFTVHTSAATADEAIKLGTQQADKLKELLARKLGKRGHVEVTPYRPWISQEQQHNRPRYQPSVHYKKAYSAQAMLTVKTKRLDLFAELIQTATANGATSINSVSFSLSNDSAIRTEAIAAAGKDAQNKARTIANSTGVKLGKLISISIHVQAQPVVVYGRRIEAAMGTAGGASSAIRQAVTPLLPHQVHVKAWAYAVYQID